MASEATGSSGLDILIRVDVDAPASIEADLVGALGLFERQAPTHSAREELEQLVRLEVRRELPDTEIRISFARGSVIVFVALSMAGGIIGNAAYDAARRISQNLVRAIRNWVGERFGIQPRVTAGTFAPAPRATGAVISGRPWPDGLAGAGIAALLLAQLTLIFIVVWLVTRHT
jgi:hypothetical protein